MCGSFLANGLPQVPHCRKTKLGLRSQRGFCQSEGKRWKSTKQLLVGQLQAGGQEPSFGVHVPALPLTELCDVAPVTRPLCACFILSHDRLAPVPTSQSCLGDS